MADAAITIIGGGVVGLAIAAELSATHSPIILLERHPACGRETSGRNSEVIHAGIYYPNGSLKARLCIEGKKLLYALCSENEIPHRPIGKIITAITRDELPALEALFDHGRKNGVPLKLLTVDAVASLEPNIRTVGGILSPSTGIISAHGLMDYFRHTALARGTIIQTGCAVTGINKLPDAYRITMNDHGSAASLDSDIVVNAAGLDADTVAAMAGIDTALHRYSISWAKGSYFAVRGGKRTIVRHLIYPMPKRDSLGVHAVVDLGGGLRFGPDVEYLTERVQDYSVDDRKRATFGEAVRTIIPSLADEDLSPDQSGIRAKLQRPGDEARDFIIRDETEKGLNGFINLIGIDSPGLTASPAIARYVREIIEGL